MSRILVSVSPAPGHVNPLLLISEHLRKRGHHITFHTAEIFREKVESAGLTFIPFQGIANFDYRLMDELFPERSTHEPGLAQLNYDMEYFFGARIPDQYKGMQQIIDEDGIDLVMTDLCMFGSFPLLLGAKEPRPPVITCGIVPYWLRRPEVSPFTGLDSTAEGLLRNAEHNRQIEEALAPATESINKILRTYGISTSIDFVFDASCTLPDVFLQLTAEEFEYPIQPRPKNLQFVGPIVPKVMDKAEEPEWLKKIDGTKPVIFVTQGTIANYDFTQLVIPTLAALAEEDVQVIVTGGGVDVSSIPALPNAHIERYLPYHLILPKADIFITNGGYNGVQQALSFGVPVISGGATEDKPFVSARVAWSGVGIDLKTGTPSPEQIRDAVRCVLNDRKYRERAKEMEKNFARYDALATITEMVDATVAKGNWREKVAQAV